MIERFIDAAVDRHRTVFLLLIFILVAGSISYINIPKESAPDIQIPIIYVSMRHEGISPQDAERLLLRPMERELQSIEGLKRLEGTANEGFGSIVLEFDAGFNADRALEDVRNKVDEVKPELPTETDEPIVQEVNFSRFPVLNVILGGDVSRRTLIKLAKGLQDKIEGVSTVLEAKISGDREEALEIIIDPLLLQGYGVTTQEAFTLLRNNNILVPAGDLDTSGSNFAIKLPGVIESLQDLQNLPIKVKGDAVITLDDIADIRRSYKDIRNVANMNGQPSVALSVSKRSGANIIETVNLVRELVAVERQSWPQGVNVTFSQDESNKIFEMLSDLQNNIIFAVLLVVIVILAVMGTRNAILVALTIPGAFLFGILCLSLGGYTLNVVVLFSLILSVGLLVDAGIVVSEYADRKMMEGKTVEQAYPMGAKRMAWPVIASTITTLIVFAPLLFWPGITGQFMRYMPITLMFTLVGSLLMALVFLPTIGAKLRLPGRIDPVQAKRIIAAEQGNWADLGRFTNSYVRTLRGFLKRPLFLVLATLVAVTVIIFSFVKFGGGVEFFPKIEPENAKILVRARGNMSVEEKVKRVKEVEKALLDMKDEVRVFYTTAGKLGNDTRNRTEDTIGEIQMEFVNWRNRRRADEILLEAKKRTAGIAGVIVETQKKQEGPASGKPVQIEISSINIKLIEPYTTRMFNALQKMDGFKDLEDSRPIPEIEWELTVDRELSGRYGLDILTIGNFVKMVTNGIIVTTYRPDDADDEVDIVLRFPEKYRNLGQLDSLRLNTVDGRSIPISNIVKRKPNQKITTINRVDGRQVMTIKSDLKEGVLADQMVTKIKEWMAENPPSPELNVTFRGEDEEQAEAGIFLAGAFVIALFMMALVMVTQFNSIYYMFVIMSAVFFSTGGVMLGLLIAGEAFGIVMCGVAIIALAGVVVNNNIIFIDTFVQYRKQGMEAQEALLRTGAQRLRPILLTAITTMLGLVPMVFAMNIDFIGRDISFGAPSTQWWKQLSTSIAGGLAFATFLTLLFTPCLLLLGERFFDRKKLKAEMMREV